MKHQLIRRVVALLLVAAFILPAGAAFATEQGAALTATGTTTMTINEQQVASARQGERIVIAGSNFRLMNWGAAGSRCPPGPYTALTGTASGSTAMATWLSN